MISEKIDVSCCYDSLYIIFCLYSAMTRIMAIISAMKDTITIWLTDSTLYSQNQITTIVEYSFTDTLGITDYVLDTIPVRFTTPRATRGVKIEVPVFTIEANIRSGSLKPDQQIVLKSKTPFRQPDTTLINLYEQFTN